MVRTRFAPSPTGAPHVGSAYTALLNYAFAKQKKGKFILRIEDTDRERFVEGAEKEIFDSLRWLGLSHDEGPDVGGDYGPYRQSERLNLYQKYARQLVGEGKAYYCFCSPERLEKMRQEQQKAGRPPKYDRRCLQLSRKGADQRIKSGEDCVIRLKVPDNQTVEFEDLIRGKVSVESSAIDDQVLLKSDGFPTYHLGVVVDDHLMKITHIIRAEEWLSSAPKHVLLYKAFGWELPQFAHTPILRGSHREKLGKRFGHASLGWFRKEGYLPGALLNFLALLGWSHPEGKGIFGLEEFVEKFSLERISPVGPVFDLQKLDWMNGKYIRQLSRDRLVHLLRRPDEEKLLKKIIPLVQERMKKLSEFEELTDFFFKEEIEIDPKLLVQKKKTVAETKKILSFVSESLSQIDLWKHENLEKTCRDLAEKSGWSAKDLFMTLRIALTGKPVTPPLFETMEILGKKGVLERLKSAKDTL